MQRNQYYVSKMFYTHWGLATFAFIIRIIVIYVLSDFNITGFLYNINHYHIQHKP